MEKEIKKILKDLYKMDRYFKQNKKEVEKVVRQIVLDQPVVKVDPEFVNKLKSQLLTILPKEEVAIQQPLVKMSKDIFSKFSYSLAGAVVVLLITIPVIYFGFMNDTGLKDMSSFPSNIAGKVATVSKLSTSNNLTVKQKLLAQNDIIKFKNLQEASDFLKNNPINSYNRYGEYGGRGGFVSETTKSLGIEFAQPTGLGSADVTASVDSIGTTDYSQTNVQVQGVDEADIIKTDGKYVYAKIKNDVYILNAYPAESAEVLTKISFKDYPSNIYIKDNLLVIMGAMRYEEIYKKYPSLIRQSQYQFVKVFDTTDKKNPKLVKDLEIEGYHNSSRLIGDMLYIVSNNYNFSYIEGEPIAPRLMESSKEISTCSTNTTTGCYNPDIYYFDVPYEQYNFVTINSIDIKDSNKRIQGSIYITPSSEQMYVSPNNIYLTYTKSISDNELSLEAFKEIIYPKLSEQKKVMIKKIEDTDSYILSSYEKQNKILGIYSSYVITQSQTEQQNISKQILDATKLIYKDISAELQKTVVHKVAINNGKLEFVASGLVTGRVNNQFSMDEYKGNFRIATTKDRTWSQFEEETNQKSYNNLYVLDKSMKTIGKVEKLAEGEQIYSVRYINDIAYMVTFRQTDPLFVISTKDPTNPKVMGKLKIPGFSDYLHPFDETTLIGVGKDTKIDQYERVITNGVKVSLFDVSDLNNPKEIDSYIMGGQGSQSEVSQDHKAFLFDKTRKMLVLPVYLMDASNGSYGNFVFGGAYVFNLDKTSGFTLKGKIDHSGGLEQIKKDIWSGYSDYNRNVKRSFYINDTLYTFSDTYLKANNISDLKEIKTVEIKKAKAGADDDFDITN